jgi:ketosteroid isomerase-like protein
MLTQACAAHHPAQLKPWPLDALQIRAERFAQNQAILRGDLDSAASFWLPNVVVSAGLGLAFQGSEVYRRAFVLDSAIVYDREPDSVTASQNWPLAWELGHWTGRPRAGGNSVIWGEYSAMWMKVGNRWLIRSELFVATNCVQPACAWPAAAR